MKNTLTIKLLAIWMGFPICLIVFAIVATNLSQAVALQTAASTGPQIEQVADHSSGLGPDL